MKQSTFDRLMTFSQCKNGVNTKKNSEGEFCRMCSRHEKSPGWVTHLTDCRQYLISYCACSREVECGMTLLLALEWSWS